MACRAVPRLESFPQQSQSILVFKDDRQPPTKKRSQRTLARAPRLERSRSAGDGQAMGAGDVLLYFRHFMMSNFNLIYYFDFLALSPPPTYAFPRGVTQ